MKTLSEFLAEELIDREDYFGPNAGKEYQEMVKWYANEIHTGMEKYKKHLQKDCPKTVHWAMIEKQIIEALTKAEQMPSTPKDEDICDYPKIRMKAECDNCVVKNCKMRLVDGCFTADELMELSAKAASANRDKEVCANPKLKAEIGCDDCDARNNCKVKGDQNGN